MPKTFNRDIELAGTSKITKNGSDVIGADGTVTIANLSITRAKLSTEAAVKHDGRTLGTIATTGNTDVYMLAPSTGSVSAVYFNANDALAANDANYITFSLVNLGQTGAGSANILSAGDANTTKSTGGTALSATTTRTMVLTSTSADLNVTVGDLLRFRAAASGTLANQVTIPRILVKYGGST